MTKVIENVLQKRQEHLKWLFTGKLILLCFLIGFLSGFSSLRSWLPLGLKFENTQNHYHFSRMTLGFIVGEANFFQLNTETQAEKKIVEAFPKEIQSKAQPIVRLVLKLSEKHQIDPYWVLSMIWTESHFNNQAISHKGARGYMQVMPETQLFLTQRLRQQKIPLLSDEPTEALAKLFPKQFALYGQTVLREKLYHLESAIFYMTYLHQEFDGNTFLATVAYNMGPGWAKQRLKDNKVVAQRSNHYLKKVLDKYFELAKNLQFNTFAGFPLFTLTNDESDDLFSSQN
jgi:hypothetical protein